MKSVWRTIGMSALVAGTLGGTYVGAARAGFKAPDPVSIDTVARKAHGSFGSARNSADANQFIFCYVDAFVGSLSLSCRAANNASPPVDVSCTSTNTALIGNVQKLSTDADVTFTWDTSGHCTSVLIDRASKWEPKKP
jgi:hypothetical protein